MKQQEVVITAVIAALGGMVAGAAVALLFAPKKGESLRDDIKQFLKSKGIMPKNHDLDELVDEIAKQIK
ncbi:MAG: YtxH domain-containing protein [Muribaculaceae bacterium]|nr:YtxH domain-containing protein [Muribaculaceae bacterium]MDE5934997.1 YtxH domain-containing protein [Muribaculaceae bacterium]MDE6610602.1 YtxH domain-containing protein [Muribaculaceae bacterium]